MIAFHLSLVISLKNNPPLISERYYTIDLVLVTKSGHFLQYLTATLEFGSP